MVYRGQIRHGRVVLASRLVSSDEVTVLIESAIQATSLLPAQRPRKTMQNA